MVIAGYSLLDKLGKIWFFKEVFLLTDISKKVVLEMPFLTFSNTNIRFIEKELVSKSYTTTEALPSTKRVKLIDRKNFTTVALDENKETFIVYVVTLSAGPKKAIHIS